MKKFARKILVACTCATPVVLGVAFGIGSVFLPKKVTHIIEPTKEEKQKQCEEGSSTCDFEVTLKEEPQANHQVKVTTQITSAYDSNVRIDESVIATVQDKKANFDIQIYYGSTNATEIWANFNVTVAYINQETGATDWTQEITGYKISAKKDITKHTISVASTLNDITFTCDKTSPQENDKFNLTIKNNRSEAISDANLTIIAGANYVNENLVGTLAAGETKTLTYTLKQVKDTYFQGKTIPDDASFTFKLVRCGAYTVDANYYVHVINYNGENGEALTKEEIPEQKFLTKNSYGEYILQTKTFQQFLTSVSQATYELTMLRGVFFNEEKQGAANTCTLKMTGVLDSSGKRVSSLRFYGRDESGYGEADGYGPVTFDLYNMIIQGRDSKIGGYYAYQGMQCNGISGNNCYLTGAITIWGGNSTFTNCTIDSTKTYKDGEKGGIKNNYPMWLYKNTQATFDHCTFKSIGKAIKIYPQGDLTTTANTFNVNLSYCSFELEDPAEEMGTMEEYEYPLNICVENFSLNTYNVNISNCTVNDYWKSKISTLTNDKLYWIQGYTVSGGYARNATINGQQVTPDKPL